jgi:acyl-CoA synthetase (AMP-forming)/AMP-acid ligase II/pimeloyl-ACP methyl ester carboxylesterase
VVSGRSTAVTAAAELPPTDLSGLRPEWSRLVTAVDTLGVERTWHVLDNGVTDVVGTIVCVHGNPTWAYTWRRVLETAPQGWRVVAVDHLDMGFSERTGTQRRLAQRIDDLCTVTDALQVSGPVVTLAHDWGGPISLGWALRHLEQLVGVVLTNTAVHQPAGSPAPSLIRLVRSRPLLGPVTTRTLTFVRGTLGLSRPRPPRTVRDAYEAPYLTADRRRAIGEFVEDIPLDPSHPSAGTLDAIAAGLTALADVPVLLLWGPRDPVFSDLYLRDLIVRVPHAAVHRYEGASHLVVEDADVAGAVRAWVSDLSPADRVAAAAGATDPGVAGGSRPLWSAIETRRGDDDPAVVEMEGETVSASASFADFAADVDALAAGLAVHGVRAGDRVALLVPPGIDLATAVYACWRRGASVVIADAGLGPRGISAALRSASPQFLIGIPRALAAARVLRWPGSRIAAGELTPARRRSLGVSTSMAELITFGRTALVPDGPADDAEAAVLFTSGATGPAKGVVYLHHQLQRQRDALMATYGVVAEDRLVAAFAPFALYGPAMGVTSVVPDMDVTAPATLTATALAGAVAAVDATLVFASPAALVNVVATASGLTFAQRTALQRVRTVMSAGAPVPTEVLRSASELMGGAEAHTPYGMTEVLPVADITLTEIDAMMASTDAVMASTDAVMASTDARNGVCVGHPVSGVAVRVVPLDPDGRATSPLDVDGPVLVGVTGEVCVSAPHRKQRYDRLWSTEAAASRDTGWHRTGDVGHIDADGRLWIEGRLGHVIVTDTGVVTPVGAERAVETLLDEVRAAAVVGIGPVGTQQVVVVVVPSTDPPAGARLASVEVTDRVRAAAEPVLGRGIASVVEVATLPVDIRHNSKIDRTLLGSWAGDVLDGGRLGRRVPWSRR